MLPPLKTGLARGMAPKSVGRDTGQLGAEGDLRAPPARGDWPSEAGGSGEVPLTVSSGLCSCSPVHLCCSHLLCGHLAGQQKFKAAQYIGRDRALSQTLAASVPTGSVDFRSQQPEDELRKPSPLAGKVSERRDVA